MFCVGQILKHPHKSRVLKKGHRVVIFNKGLVQTHLKWTATFDEPNAIHFLDSWTTLLAKTVQFIKNGAINRLQTILNYQKRQVFYILKIKNSFKKSEQMKENSKFSIIFQTRSGQIKVIFYVLKTLDIIRHTSDIINMLLLNVNNLIIYTNTQLRDEQELVLREVFQIFPLSYQKNVGLILCGFKI